MVFKFMAICVTCFGNTICVEAQNSPFLNRKFCNSIFYFSGDYSLLGAPPTVNVCNWGKGKGLYKIGGLCPAFTYSMVDVCVFYNGYKHRKRIHRARCLSHNNAFIRCTNWFSGMFMWARTLMAA